MSKKIIDLLLKIKAIEIKKDKNDWFTWTSGIKSPIYCDNRLIISYPDVRKTITENFVSLIKKNFKDIDYIAGTATAGIPHAAWVSDKLNLPMIFVRSEAKKHGKSKQIEGMFEKGKNVVVIEDLISTGKSSINVCKALNENALNVVGVVAIFSYNLPIVKKSFDDINVPFYTMTNYDFLLEYLDDEKIINNNQKSTLKIWRDELLK